VIEAEDPAERRKLLRRCSSAGYRSVVEALHAAIIFARRRNRNDD
jgi:hypothetical protein